MQQQGLGAVVAHLPEMEPQYRMMVQSLDNTRHHMKTSELVVPSEGVCVCVHVWVGVRVRVCGAQVSQRCSLWVAIVIFQLLWALLSVRAFVYWLVRHFAALLCPRL